MRQVKYYSCAFTLLEMAFLIGRHKKFLWIVALCELFKALMVGVKKTHGLQYAALEGYREGYDVVVHVETIESPPIS
ncbi:hypothetical protein [Plesiomonas shigelloides]|uniref:hypothetical protein n=1 Tax=Plesiomonas shigelloides TaxID=703 RepID=UPI0014839464|nr:hypothetical protein [Plesiomonas shigelloides]